MTQRILYVDDEPDIRAVAEIALQIDPELDVRTCGSGPEGISTALEWQPHLIMLDVMMPGMDGPAVLRALGANDRTSRIPVVFITARTQAADKSRLMEMGAIGVIAKPFDPMELAATVRAYLREGASD
ncbi:MAG TPA: response regulator [Sphingomicrobium sp.]